MLNTILVAVDGSSHSMHAASVAGEIAHRYGATLILLHVMGAEPMPKVELHEAEIAHLNMAEQGLIQANKVHAAQRADGFALLQRAEQPAKTRGVEPIIHELADGNPADQVLHHARRYQADLIVMGTRGLSDVGSLLLGSVSHKVSQLAECACLTTH